MSASHAPALDAIAFQLVVRERRDHALAALRSRCLRLLERRDAATR